ncbi:antitoxin family protein [Zavarzinella formosa]|uniref:antitoxin family protein n=1 Tax=Zavarzinella formosa TaxID=360055 RepID=UPI0002EC2041|nr:antitoxin family protein [Zavarzinella formosa]
MTTISAIFEGGVFRPTEPPGLSEGQRVQLTVLPFPAIGPERLPTTEDVEYARRVSECKSIDEWFALMATMPPDDGGYDIIAELNEDRRWSGREPSLPAEVPEP